jgi:hypothetical protein
MSDEQLAELDTFIPTMIAQDELREHEHEMKPEDVYKLALIATNDEFLARRRWRAAVGKKMDQFMGDV